MENKKDSNTNQEDLMKVSETDKEREEGGEETNTKATTTTKTTKTMNNNNQDTKEEDEEEEEKVNKKKDNNDDDDEEGLKFQYDVILYGTGLVESIVASALARAGKTILHCDASDHYGSLDAVWTLSYIREYQNQQFKQQQQQSPPTIISTKEELTPPTPPPTPTNSLHVRFKATASSTSTIEETNHLISVSSQGNIGLEIHSMERLQEYSITKPGTIVTTQYGMAKVHTITKDNLYVHCTFSLTSWTLTNGSHAKLHLTIPLQQLTMNDENENNINNQQQLSTLKDPQDWNQEQLQTLVDRYYARQTQSRFNTRNGTNSNTNGQSSSSTTTTKTTKPLSSQSNLASLQSWHEFVDYQILDHGRSPTSFALDVSPGLLFAWGPAVQGLLQSSVADYVEFKSLEQLLYNMQLQPVPCSKNDVFSSSLLTPMEKRRLMKFLQLALDYGLLTNNNNNNNKTTSDSGGGGGDGSSTGNATTTTTTTTELSDDQPGLEPKPTSEEAVKSWNERHLNQGRSLARPQNKAVTTEDMNILQQCLIEEERQIKKWDMELYLKEKHRLSTSLISLVRHALALEPIVCDDTNSNSHGTVENDDDHDQNNTITTRTNDNNCQGLKQGMHRLCRHMQALGRFGSTAFLVPLYGSGELAQAFCRSAAVYGATYLLRRSLSHISIRRRGTVTTTATTSSSETDKTDIQLTSSVTGVWLQPPQLEDTIGEDEKQQQQDDDDDKTNKQSFIPSSKHIKCTHVIVPDYLLLLASSKVRPTFSLPPVRRRVLRRISILRGKPFTSSPDEQQRLAWVLPPDPSINGSGGGGDGNKIGNLYTIHGFVLDESAQVAPYLSVKEPRIGCSVVHLSTVVDVEVDGSLKDEQQLQQEVDDSVLKRAMETILAQQGSKTNKSTTGASGGSSSSSSSTSNSSTTERMVQKDDCQEIFHVSFSFPLFNKYEADEVTAGCKGLHVVHRPAPGLVLDTAFEQAKEIFHKICPDQEFLVLATELDTMVKERFGDRTNPDDDDDEKRLLESAMNMIQQQKQPSGETNKMKGDGENEPLMTDESSTVKQEN